MKYLLDTCTLSEYVKKKPNPKVIDWLDNQDEEQLFVTIITIAELRKGISKLKISNPNRYQKLNNWLFILEKRFTDKILPLDKNILEIWAITCGESEAKGKKLPIIDSLIASTAIYHQLTIVTRNVDDFKLCFPEICIFNPWLK